MLTAAVAMAAALAGAAGKAGAGESADARGRLASVNAVRSTLGLEPLRADPLALAVVRRMARSDSRDRPPEALEALPACAVCETYAAGGRLIDPARQYRSLGGLRPIRFALWRDGWTAAQNLAVFFPTSALLLDPRARTFASFRTPRGMVVVGVTFDPAAKLRRPVIWPATAVNPRLQLWAEALLPRGQGYPKLHERRGDRDVVVAYPLAAGRGFGRSRLVAFGLTTSLAYGRTYRIGLGRLSVPFRTRAAPRTFLRRSWTFTGLTTEQQAAFLAVVRTAPPSLRRVLGELDGAVEIVGGPDACSSADACEEVTEDRARVGFAGQLDPYRVWHELGHVAFDLALDERGRRIFLAAFQTAGWREYCCINLSEVFADQIAFWALGGVPPDVATYSDRLYLPPRELARLMRENAAYRPLPVVGPLGR